jgi:hypothetical protein
MNIKMWLNKVWIDSIHFQNRITDFTPSYTIKYLKSWYQRLRIKFKIFWWTTATREIENMYFNERVDGVSFEKIVRMFNIKIIRLRNQLQTKKPLY